MSRSRTAGWRNGRRPRTRRSRARPSQPPRPDRFPRRGRWSPGPGARSAIMAPSEAATRAPPKSPIAAELSGRTIRRSPSELTVRDSEPVESHHGAPDPLDQLVSDLVLPQDPNPRPVLLVTNTASRSSPCRRRRSEGRSTSALREQRHERLVLHLTEPAESKAGTLSAGSTRKARSRPGTGRPRHRAVHPDQEASRREDRLHQGDAGRLERRVPSPSPPRPDRPAPSRSVERQRPAGEPSSRCMMAPDPRPIRRPATMPMGNVTPRAIPRSPRPSRSTGR